MSLVSLSNLLLLIRQALVNAMLQHPCIRSACRINVHRHALLALRFHVSHIFITFVTSVHQHAPNFVVQREQYKPSRTMNFLSGISAAIQSVPPTTRAGSTSPQVVQAQPSHAPNEPPISMVGKAFNLLERQVRTWRQIVLFGVQNPVMFHIP